MTRAPLSVRSIWPNFFDGHGGSLIPVNSGRYRVDTGRWPGHTAGW